MPEELKSLEKYEKQKKVEKYEKLKKEDFPTPVDSRIAPKFDEFPDENDENDVPP